MFKIKTKSKPAPDETAKKLEQALSTWRLVSEFFADRGPLEIRPGERLEDLIARSLGVTRAAFDDTCRFARSIAAGRVIPRD